MQSLARKRQAERAQALGPLGLASYTLPRIFASQTRGILSEADALRLPPDPDSLPPVVVSTLAPRPFVIGMDPLDGSFPLT